MMIYVCLGYHHENIIGIPQLFHNTRTDKGRHRSHPFCWPVDAQESRALRNPVQSNSWVHNGGNL